MDKSHKKRRYAEADGEGPKGPGLRCGKGSRRGHRLGSLSQRAPSGEHEAEYQEREREPHRAARAEHAAGRKVAHVKPTGGRKVRMPGGESDQAEKMNHEEK